MNLVQKEFSYTEYYDEQREFARRDYEGLDKESSEFLKNKRREIAKSLNADRNFNNESYNSAKDFIKNTRPEFKKEQESSLLKTRNTRHNINLNFYKVSKDKAREMALEATKENKALKKMARRDKIAAGVTLGLGSAGLAAFAAQAYHDNKKYKNKNKKEDK